MVTQQAVGKDVFKALADPTRRAILDLLRQGEQSVGQIARLFPTSRPAISKHLCILRKAELVIERREGRNRIYKLNSDPLREVNEWLNVYRKFWRKSLVRLKRHVESSGSRRAD